VRRLGKGDREKKRGRKRERDQGEGLGLHFPVMAAMKSERRGQLVLGVVQGKLQRHPGKGMFHFKKKIKIMPAIGKGQKDTAP